jgi:hypothetical protein
MSYFSKLLPITIVFAFQTLHASDQLESLVTAFAIKTTDDVSNTSWNETYKIKGIKWKWPDSELGAHNYRMVGMTKVGKSKYPNYGRTTVTITGSKSMLSDITITIDNNLGGTNLFGKGKVTHIKTSCDLNNEDGMNSYQLYSFEKKGYKPIFINHTSFYGSTGGSDELYLAYSLDDVFSHNSDSSDKCKILK